MIARKNILGLVLAVVLLGALSCTRHVEQTYVSIPYVDILLADSLSSLKGLAGQTGKSSGTIALVGDPHNCLKVSEMLMSSDSYDNIDGHAAPDGLPDFAGETIASILDFTYAPFDSLLQDNDTVSLKEIAVKSSRYALDTTCHFTPYGSTMISKGSPKVLVVCSPVLSEVALEDIKDFYRRIGCNIPVIASTDTTFSYSGALFKLLREKNMFTHDIAYPVACGYIPVEAGTLSRPKKVLTLYDESYVPENWPDTLNVIAPKTIDSYVHD